LAVKSGDIFHTRRLAGAAERQVADADDGHIRFQPALPSLVVQPIPQPHAPAIWHAQQSQPAALQTWPNASRSAADQVVEGFTGGCHARYSVECRPRQRRAHASYSPAVDLMSTGIVVVACYGGQPI